MADSAVDITPGTGISIDTRTENLNGNHRQVMIIGDPVENGGLAPVDATKGLSVFLGYELPAGTQLIGKVTAQGAAAAGAAASGNPVPVSAIYKATPATRSDGQVSNLVTDEKENLKVREQFSPVAENDVAGVIGTILKPVNDATYSPNPADNTYATPVTKKNVKGSPGNTYSVQVFNFGASLGYFQLHNKASAAPVATETPMSGCVWPVPAGTATQPGVLALTIDDLAPSTFHSTGIGWALSSARNVFTDALTAADFLVNVRTV